MASERVSGSRRTLPIVVGPGFQIARIRGASRRTKLDGNLRFRRRAVLMTFWELGGKGMIQGAVVLLGVSGLGWAGGSLYGLLGAIGGAVVGVPVGSFIGKYLADFIFWLRRR